MEPLILMDNMVNLSWGGKSFEVELRALKYSDCLLLFVVEKDSRFGTVVIGEAELHEADRVDSDDEGEGVEFNV